MRASTWLWIVAVLLTLASAVWQRRTGPTQPLSGRDGLGDVTVRYALPRTHRGAGDARVEIRSLPADVTGGVEWKRHGSADPWITVIMRREGRSLAAELPHQAPGGKLWYRVELLRGPRTIVVPPDRPAAIRFTGAVPARVLVPHILCMFAAMLLAARTGLEAFRRRPALGALTAWTLGILVVGGMVLGPFVVHDAFGPWWTGFPFGSDLTDNKTLIALIGWIVAAVAVARRRGARAWVVIAALVMLGVFAIPHSWTGAEPPYSALGAPPAATR